MQYKQKFENDADSDANLFQSSFVPLQLISNFNNKVIWKNPTPSSPRFCRPIRIRFIKETANITRDEISYVESAVASLNPTNIYLQDKAFAVKHILQLTMIDTKVCNAACEN